MIHPYELDHAPASFLRGYWTAYRGRPAVNVCPLAKAEYQRGYTAGTADRAEIEHRWKRWASAAVILLAITLPVTVAHAQTTTTHSRPSRPRGLQNDPNSRFSCYSR